MDKQKNVQAGGNFEENMQKIVAFNNLKDFGTFWRIHFYDDSSNLLFNCLDDTEKRIERNGKTVIIDVLNLFREGIQPAWEDPENGKGYNLKVELCMKAELNPREIIVNTYKQLWEDFCLSLIGEECAYSSEIAGIRFKFQPSRVSMRIETWIRTRTPRPLKAPDDRETLLGGNYETCTEESFKIYWAIRLWMEDLIKGVRKNQQNIAVSFSEHNAH